ncbi:hypothetical protein LSH36_342g00022 [Paralvinella palmiformis]|uniref:Mitochondrial carrier protein n=1 Tax=Paralvinella palmiformis TaxID=53620 RepID=A0AAD9JF38_9ANNE|nr:hypothetical protein LSH36_342g00022 [Paralvinella palmiformis]
MSASNNQSVLRRTFKNWLSGTMAGVAVTLSGHPFDTLKVRLQTQPVHNPVYKGLLDCFLKTLKWEGIGGLYKGIGSPLVGQMFFRAVLFTSYHQITVLIAGPNRINKRLNHFEYFIAGGATGFVASLAESPIDLFKTKMQIQIIQAKSTGAPMLYRNVFNAGYLITKTYGIRGFYQGLQATWCRNVPAFGVFFGFYEIIRRSFIPEGGTLDDAPMYAMFLAGGIGGFLYWFLTYPTDVLKSSLQSDNSDPTKRRFRGYIDCAKYLYKKEGGIPRFFRGFTPCLMRSVPANAIQFSTFELCKRYLPF